MMKPMMIFQVRYVVRERARARAALPPGSFGRRLVAYALLAPLS